MTWFWSKTNFI